MIPRVRELQDVPPGWSYKLFQRTFNLNYMDPQTNILTRIYLSHRWPWLKCTQARVEWIPKKLEDA